MARFKIAFVGQKGIPASYGGVEKHVEELGRRLASGGHSIAAYSRGTYNSFSGYHQGIRVINLPAVSEKHAEMISHTVLSCLDLLDRDIDVVHMHSVDPAVASFIPRIKTKVLVTSHGQAYRREKWGPIAKSLSRLAERLFAKIPDARIAVSKTLKDYYETKYGCKVHYIPNGVELPQCGRYQEAKIKMQRCGNDGEEMELHKDEYIAYVGRILPTKGVDTLLDAWKMLNGSKWTSFDKKLAIVGGSSYTDKYVEDLKRRADGSVVWTGYRYGDELAQLFANAYCVVVPSEIEGLAITLLEAMSYAKCVVYSDIPENAEAAEGVGIAFRNKDAVDLAEKIKFAFKNRRMCRELGEKARERVARDYNWDDIVAKTEEVYESLFR